ncbi:MAG: hypothetical protein WB586_07045 [Chthoniobacterales bacterium]
MNPLTKFNTVFKTNKPVIAMAHLLRLPGSPLYDAERGVKGMLHCDPSIPSSVEVYYLVDDVLAAVAVYAAHGCQVLVAPFDIAIGKCAVISDPFGTRLCILDMTKGARPLHLPGSTR